MFRPRPFPLEAYASWSSCYPDELLQRDLLTKLPNDRPFPEEGDRSDFRLHVDVLFSEAGSHRKPPPAKEFTLAGFPTYLETEEICTALSHGAPLGEDEPVEEDFDDVSQHPRYAEVVRPLSPYDDEELAVPHIQRLTSVGLEVSEKVVASMFCQQMPGPDKPREVERKIAPIPGDGLWGFPELRILPAWWPEYTEPETDQDAVYQEVFWRNLWSPERWALLTIESSADTLQQSDPSDPGLHLPVKPAWLKTESDLKRLSKTICFDFVKPLLDGFKESLHASTAQLTSLWGDDGDASEIGHLREICNAPLFTDQLAELTPNSFLPAGWLSPIDPPSCANRHYGDVSRGKTLAGYDPLVIKNIEWSLRRLGCIGVDNGIAHPMDLPPPPPLRPVSLFVPLVQSDVEVPSRRMDWRVLNKTIRSTERHLRLMHLNPPATAAQKDSSNAALHSFGDDESEAWLADELQIVQAAGGRAQIGSKRKRRDAGGDATEDMPAPAERVAAASSESEVLDIFDKDEVLDIRILRISPCLGRAKITQPRPKSQAQDVIWFQDNGNQSEQRTPSQSGLAALQAVDEEFSIAIEEKGYRRYLNHLAAQSSPGGAKDAMQPHEEYRLACLFTDLHGHFRNRRTACEILACGAASHDKRYRSYASLMRITEAEFQSPSFVNSVLGPTKDVLLGGCSPQMYDTKRVVDGMLSDAAVHATEPTNPTEATLSATPNNEERIQTPPTEARLLTPIALGRDDLIRTVPVREAENNCRRSAGSNGDCSAPPRRKLFEDSPPSASRRAACNPAQPSDEAQATREVCRPKMELTGAEWTTLSSLLRPRGESTLVVHADCSAWAMYFCLAVTATLVASTSTGCIIWLVDDFVASEAMPQLKRLLLRAFPCNVDTPNVPTFDKKPVARVILTAASCGVDVAEGTAEGIIVIGPNVSAPRSWGTERIGYYSDLRSRCPAASLFVVEALPDDAHELEDLITVCPFKTVVTKKRETYAVRPLEPERSITTFAERLMFVARNERLPASAVRVIHTVSSLLVQHSIDTLKVSIEGMLREDDARASVGERCVALLHDLRRKLDDKADPRLGVAERVLRRFQSGIIALRSKQCVGLIARWMAKTLPSTWHVFSVGFAGEPAMAQVMQSGKQDQPRGVDYTLHKLGRSKSMVAVCSMAMLSFTAKLIDHADILIDFESLSGCPLMSANLDETARVRILMGKLKYVNLCMGSATFGDAYIDSMLPPSFPTMTTTTPQELLASIAKLKEPEALHEVPLRTRAPRSGTQLPKVAWVLNKCASDSLFAALSSRTLVNWLDDQNVGVDHVQVVQRGISQQGVAVITLDTKTVVLVEAAERLLLPETRKQLKHYSQSGFKNVWVVGLQSAQHRSGQVSSIGNTPVRYAANFREVSSIVGSVRNKVAQANELNALLLHPKKSLPNIDELTWSNPLCYEPLASELAYLALGVTENTAKDTLLKVSSQHPLLCELVQHAEPPAKRVRCATPDTAGDLFQAADFPFL
ncbi:hypothetical protein DIPPA_23793 [Diplonema papillatum]|nr:hypothetical protein DIPPA_23793 [Diplonema papillatum]